MSDPHATARRIGIFGGTFDPIHLGHLVLAEDAVREVGLDEVVFVPAFLAPLRSEEPRSEPPHRWEMVRRAIGGFPRFSADDFEIRAGRQVYSIETVRHFAEERPGDELFFLIGGDQVRRLGEWKGIDEFRRLATFVCARREEGNEFSGDPRLLPLPSRRIDVSGTEIRDRAARAEPVRSLVPGPVADYLEEHSLYRRG